MQTFTIDEQNMILGLYFSRHPNNNDRSQTYFEVANEFNQSHQRAIRSRDVQRLVERLEQYGVCLNRHHRNRSDNQVVSPEIQRRVNEHYMVEENRNDSLRVAGRKLDLHHTTVLR